MPTACSSLPKHLAIVAVLFLAYITAYELEYVALETFKNLESVL